MIFPTTRMSCETLPTRPYMLKYMRILESVT